jgi:enhancer of polycomb-like protein
VPPPEESKLNYDDLYSLPFQKPNSYIRFSQTVEECIGCQYDMTEDDDAFLKSYNQKLGAASAQLSEDDFERLMEVFEETAYIKAPFASIDQTIVPFDDMIAGLQQLGTAKVMPHAKELYEYWKSRRQALSNRPLHPTLKFETHQESDDLDPYICFRRREVRQTRKTRARDVQSAEKLKRLRRELEDGRQLIIASYERELLKKEMLNADRIIFEQRAALKEAKIRMGIKTDDEDLINQKVSTPVPTSLFVPVLTNEQPQKRKAVEPPPARPPPAKELRVNPVVHGSRPAESDLPQLADKLAERELNLRADIEQKIRNHNFWNAKFVDLTRDPLPPVRGETPDLSFRPAKTQYLMTPPASASNESMEEPTAMDLDTVEKVPMYGFRGVAHDEKSSVDPPAYRRRIGRLNRLWIDRRGLASPPREPVESGVQSSDRWKYDQDSDDEGEQPVYELDPFDTRALKFRASVPLPYLRGKPQMPELVTSFRQQGLQPPPPPQQVAPQQPPAGS